MRKRISSNLEPEFYAEVKAAADRRGVSVSKVIADALSVEVEHTDLRQETTRLENKVEALRRQKQRLIEFRNDVVTELASVAKKLGVKGVSGAVCCEKIDALIAAHAEQVDALEVELASANSKNSALINERDKFKSASEEANAKLQNAEATLAAIEKQGPIARLLRKPVDAVPFDKPVAEQRDSG